MIALATLLLLWLTLSTLTIDWPRISLLYGQGQDPLGQATHITVGRVEEVESSWENGTIVTHVAVKVVESLKGGLRVNSSITLKHYGGEVGTVGLRGSNQPIFVKGERAKLFLQLGKDGVFTVVNGGRGKISLDKPALYGFPGYAVDYPPLRWSYSELPVHYRVNPTSPAGVDSSVWMAAVQTSFQTWEDDEGSKMDYNYDGTTSSTGPDPNTGYESDGLNGVYAKGGFSSSGTLAVCWCWYDISTGPTYYRILETDIIFNNAFQWSASGEAGKYDIQNVGTHEAGHTLSLGDLYSPSDSEETMYGYSDQGETKKRTLYFGDVEGIRFLYPSAEYQFSAYSITRQWSRTVPSLIEKVAQPIIYDADGDGVKDVFYLRAKYDSGTGRTTITRACIDGGTGSNRWLFAQSISNNWYADGWGSGLGLGSGDFNGDGVMDLWYCVAKKNGKYGRLLAINGHTGAQLWAKLFEEDLGVGGMGAFLTYTWNVGDMNGDGKDDLAVPVGRYLYALNGATGGQLWWRRPSSSYIVAPWPAGADLNGDGRNDLYAYFHNSGTDNTNVYAKSGADGSNIWGKTFAGSCSARTLWSDDLNGDGVPDMYVCQSSIGGSPSYKKWWFRSGKTGAALWSKSFTNPTWLYRMGGDLDGVARGDILASPLLALYASPPVSSSVQMLRGSNGWTIWSKTVTGAYQASPVGDMNGDGRRDVMLTSYPTSLSGSNVNFKAIAKNGVNGVNLWQKTSGLSIPVPAGITWAHIGWTGAYSYTYNMDDLNGDGREDTAIGVVFHFWKSSTNCGTRGKAFVVNGNDGGTIFSFYVRTYQFNLGNVPMLFNAGNVAGTSQPDVLVYTNLAYYMYRR